MTKKGQKTLKPKCLLNGLKIGFMDKTYIHKFLFAQFIYYFYEKFIYLHFITFKHKQNEPSNNRFLPLFNHIPWPFMGPNDSIGIILVFYFKEEALSFPKHYLLLLSNSENEKIS